VVHVHHLIGRGARHYDRVRARKELKRLGNSYIATRLVARGPGNFFTTLS
jgi:hypothetical protein